jgi:hypothetical protein
VLALTGVVTPSDELRTTHCLKLEQHHNRIDPSIQGALCPIKANGTWCHQDGKYHKALLTPAKDTPAFCVVLAWSVL